MGYCLPGSSVHGDSLGKNTGVGFHALLQGIFPTQGSNPGLLHCWQILYYLSHQGRPWILEWVAYPFSRGSSQPRNWTRVSCTVGGFFTSWATREILKQGGEGIWGKKGREIIICKGPVGGPEGQFGGIKVWWPPWSPGHDEGMEGHCKRIRWGGRAQSLKAVRSNSRLLPWLWE